MKILDIDEFEEKYSLYGKVLYREIGTCRIYEVEFDCGKAIVLKEVVLKPGG